MDEFISLPTLDLAFYISQLEFLPVLRHQRIYYQIAHLSNSYFYEAVQASKGFRELL